MVKQQQQQHQQQQKPVSTPKRRTPSTSPSSSSSSSMKQTQMSGVDDPLPAFQSSTPIERKTPADGDLMGLFDTPPSSTTYQTSSGRSSFSPSSPHHIYLKGLQSKPSTYDTVYGVRFGTKEHKSKKYIGNLEVRFPTGKVQFYRNGKNVAVFDGAPQLYDLIFLKSPQVLGHEDKLNDNVVQSYKKILQLTDAAYKDYDKTKELRETRWPKKFTNYKTANDGIQIGIGCKKKSRCSQKN